MIPQILLLPIAVFITEVSIWTAVEDGGEKSVLLCTQVSVHTHVSVSAVITAGLGAEDTDMITNPGTADLCLAQ